MSRTVLTIVWLLVVVAYAALSTVWVSQDPGWYAGLRKPWFQPPDVVFGIIWPLNFLALGIVGFFVTQRGTDRVVVLSLALLVVSAGLALAWAYLFYVPHELSIAAGCLIAGAALTWLLVAVVGSGEWWWALALVPYAGWLSIASALAVGYSRLN